MKQPVKRLLVCRVQLLLAAERLVFREGAAGPGGQVPPCRSSGQPRGSWWFQELLASSLEESQLGEGRWKLLWNCLFIYMPACFRKDLKRLRNCFV